MNRKDISDKSWLEFRKRWYWWLVPEEVFDREPKDHPTMGFSKATFSRLCWANFWQSYQELLHSATSTNIDNDKNDFFDTQSYQQDQYTCACATSLSSEDTPCVDGTWRNWHLIRSFWIYDCVWKCFLTVLSLSKLKWKRRKRLWRTLSLTSGRSVMR